jgi:hypothetical protein
MPTPPSEKPADHADAISIVGRSTLIPATHPTAARAAIADGIRTAAGWIERSAGMYSR